MRRYLPFFCVISGFFLLVCWIAFPAIHHAKTAAYRSSCQSNLKQIAQAARLYSRDYDSRLQISYGGIGETGWATALAPYSGSKNIFECPATTPAPHADTTDYFFNANLSGRFAQNLQSDKIILFGDGFDNAGTNSHLLELPLDWRREDFEGRHWRSGLNLVFADGHVKFMPCKWIGRRPGEGIAEFFFQP